MTLQIDVLGDSGPFSRTGKGIAYRIRAGSAQFLIDCGAPVLSLLGPGGIEELDGIIATHAHDDHKRWFTDLALFQKYSRRDNRRLRLLAPHRVLRDFRRSCGPALEKTLSPDSRRVMDQAFDTFVEPVELGPAPRVQCQQACDDSGSLTWRAVDRQGAPLPPERARVVRSQENARPRLLWKDPREEIWIEPRAYYPFTDDRFYQPADPEAFSHQHESGLVITPVKATAWHGPFSVSLLFEFEGEKVFFSSDTVYDPDLWEELARSSAERGPGKESAEPEPHPVGDINDFVQQTWSQERLDRAREMYSPEHVMIHEVSHPRSPVHTDYRHLENWDGPLLLTHAPDRFTARHPIARPGKTFVLQDGTIRERTPLHDPDLPLNADCYKVENDRYFVGYEDPEGAGSLLRSGPGQYELQPDPGNRSYSGASLSMSVYRDIDGEYLPWPIGDDETYERRPDGRIERRRYTDDDSTGYPVDGRRLSRAGESR